MLFLNRQSTQKFKLMGYGKFDYIDTLNLPFTCGFDNLQKTLQVQILIDR